MNELLSQLLAAREEGRRLTWCRLVETRGSTPQKAGAAMVVFEDGGQAGTLGGGCVEAEVKRQALLILAEGEAKVASFQLDSDYGWDDGLICGGRMTILVQPVATEADLAYFRQLHNLVESRQGFTEAIVFDGEKSGLVAPTSVLFDPSGIRRAAVPQASDALSEAVRTGLVPLSDRPRPSAKQGVAYLPTLPRCRLLVVGGGHVGQAVGNLASDLDFDVWVADDRAEYASQERFPKAQRLVSRPFDRMLEELEITSDTYCLIVTRGHQHDEQALYHLIDRGARYVGLIGSRRKIKLIFDDLESKGVSKESLAKVYAPLGIEIGSQTVPEIAVSILAELIAHRNLGGRVPGRPKSSD
jgi:xanthine dehydrogenase accessory factor